MPGMSMSISMPFIFIRIGAGTASGTFWRRSRSHCCMSAISSVCALMMRSQSVRSGALAPCVGAHLAMTMACAWWLIIPCMKYTSASVYGRRALSARALTT